MNVPSLRAILLAKDCFSHFRKDSPKRDYSRVQRIASGQRVVSQKKGLGGEIEAVSHQHVTRAARLSRCVCTSLWRAGQIRNPMVVAGNIVIESNKDLPYPCVRILDFSTRQSSIRSRINQSLSKQHISSSWIWKYLRTGARQDRKDCESAKL